MITFLGFRDHVNAFPKNKSKKKKPKLKGLTLDNSARTIKQDQKKEEERKQEQYCNRSTIIHMLSLLFIKLFSWSIILIN